MAADFLGFGLLSPFQRDGKNDFASDGGLALIKASIRNILGTRGASETAQGEYPWRTEFGSQLERLRHMPNKAVIADLAQYYVAEALARWEPRVVVKHVDVTQEDYTLTIEVTYDVIDQNVSGNNVALQDITQTVTL